MQLESKCTRNVSALPSGTLVRQVIRADSLFHGCGYSADLNKLPNLDHTDMYDFVVEQEGSQFQTCSVAMQDC